ncbi:Ig-like domain-containing protein [Actinomyces lilanjuaniae]|uniref:Ig-like domain-containing protein n=1 Tax=Actinomyces lilanjuaniae TaxID=2321394 RepID=UPI001FAA01C1|nr:Ig-like domain-containing protein [Actinomyces lilanjuaniae]
MLVAALALALAVVTPLASSAQAEESTGITVSNMSLTRVNGNNEPQEGALLYYDNARLTFDWDASGADLQPGDSFTIDLGTYFENLQRSESLPMSVSHDGADVEVGTCELTTKTIVCTFSEQVTQLRSAGFHGFRARGRSAGDHGDDHLGDGRHHRQRHRLGGPAWRGGIGTGPGYGDWEIDKWASSFYNDYSELTWGSISVPTTWLTSWA